MSDGFYAAVTEWRDARAAVLSAPSDWWEKKDDRFPPDLLNRLASAEDRLFQLAKGLPPGHQQSEEG